MRIDIITIFPDLIRNFFDFGVIGRGLKNKLFEINVIDLRDFTEDKHRSVDDYPFGGGAGMVMKCEPLFKAVESVKQENSVVVLMSPQGRKFSSELSRTLITEQHLIIVCGRYEGVDERFIENMVNLEISIGDYVISGGELAAMVVLDSMLRYIPGVLNSEESPLKDSFEEGYLDYPVYTRPRDFRGMLVPDILISGDHKKIEEWRKKTSHEKTKKNRPDLLKEKDQQ